MSRTIGHTRRQQDPAKAGVKYSSRRNCRNSNRELIHKILSGMTDWDEALWLYRPRQCIFYYGYY